MDLKLIKQKAETSPDAKANSRQAKKTKTTSEAVCPPSKTWKSSPESSLKNSILSLSKMKRWSRTLSLSKYQGATSRLL